MDVIPVHSFAFIPLPLSESVIKLQRELDLARRALEGHDRTGGGDRALPRRADVRVRVVELRRIEGVEHLRAELQASRLIRAQPEILEERKVELLRAGAAQDVAPRVAKGELRRRGETACVEPAVDRTLGAGQHGVASRHDVGALAAAAVERVDRGVHGKGEAAVKLHDAVQLPAADERFGHATRAFQQRPAVPKRQVVIEAVDQPVSQIVA